MKCDEVVRIKYKSGDKVILIKLARKELKEWQEVLRDAQQEIKDWERFIKELRNNP